MKLVARILTSTAIGLASLAALITVAGQVGAFEGAAPIDLGVKEGRLKPPSLTPNSVSSQANLYPDHPQRAYAHIDALALPGKASTDMAKFVPAVQALGGCKIVKQDASYLYAQCKTVWLGFVDDLELWAEAAPAAAHHDVQSRIEVRSASRLGRKDFGVNRARVEALRQRLMTAT
ncbi:MAG: DUF1499 domain-containing protein [Betaproteobacteria bacterium]|nr:DUF1499 domain-containing protein [Betaproteobacteria bacterium]